MPAGTVPVPINAVMGKREEGGYEFLKLDVIFLKKMGLSKQRMEQCNALFFYQLLLPIVDTAMSGIDGDTRMGCYEDKVRNTNMYAFGVKNRGGTRGHVFCPTVAEELLVWDGIVCRNINTNIADSWMMNQPNTFD
jgi:hypothetical protein